MFQTCIKRQFNVDVLPIFCAKKKRNNEVLTVSQFGILGCGIRSLPSRTRCFLLNRITSCCVELHVSSSEGYFQNAFCRQRKNNHLRLMEYERFLNFGAFEVFVDFKVTISSTWLDYCGPIFSTYIDRWPVVNGTV